MKGEAYSLAHVHPRKGRSEEEGRWGNTVREGRWKTLSTGSFPALLIVVCFVRLSTLFGVTVFAFVDEAWTAA